MLQELPVTFMTEMNDSHTKEMTQQELFRSIDSVETIKSLGHDGILVEFLKCLGLALGYNFYHMV